MNAFRTFALVAAPWAVLVGASLAAADTLDDIKQAGAITFGYRTDAAPFSYNGPDGKPKGFSVDLCQSIALPIARAAGIADFKVNFVPVSAAERFSALAAKKYDVLCEATTVTFKRRETMDFSLLTFATGASVLVRGAMKDLKGFHDLEGRKVGVLGGTTTENGLKGALLQLKVKAQVVVFSNHDLGLAALEGGVVDAYFADRELLIGLIRKAKAADQLAIATAHFSYEPYALAMRKGDDRLQLAVDRALAQLYVTGGMIELIVRNFGRNPSDELLLLYSMQTISD